MYGRLKTAAETHPSAIAASVGRKWWGMARSSRGQRVLPGHSLREEIPPAPRRVGRSWATGLAVVCGSVVLVAFVTVVAPRYLLSWDAPSTPVADRAKAVNDIRTTLRQGLAGVAC